MIEENLNENLNEGQGYRRAEEKKTQVRMATILISAPVVQIPSMTEAQRRKLSLRAPILDPTGSSRELAKP